MVEAEVQATQEQMPAGLEFLRGGLTDALRSLTDTQRRMLGFTWRATNNAQNLYSRAKVGAVALGVSGKIYPGINVEWLGKSLHAEVCSFSRGLADGERKFVAVATLLRVIDKDGKEPVIKEPPVPCGDCSQFIWERSQISEVNIQVICANTLMDNVLVLTAKDLLVHGRGPLDFGWDVSKWRTTQEPPVPAGATLPLDWQPTKL